MKNTLLVLITCSSVVFAGESVNSKSTNSTIKAGETGEKCFNESTHIINIGIGAGGGRYYRGGFGNDSYGGSPAFSLSYEQPWSKKLGPGFLGVGAYFGYQNAYYRNNYDKNNYYYEHSWNYMLVAARGAYHWDVLNSEKAEVYGGAMVGLRIQTYHYSTNNPNANAYDNRLNEGSVFPIFSAFAGARWYFAKKVAVYGEVGSGISYFTAGLSFKF
jgi:hypothetical protein